MKNARTGNYDILVPVPGGTTRGKHKWISTGETNRARAEAVVAEAGVDKLILLAKAGALTADAISVVTTGRRFTAKDVMEAWAKEAAMDVADGTVSTYRTLLIAFFEGIDGLSKPLAWFKRHHLDSYVNDSASKASTRHTRLAALRSLWSFAQSNAYITGNLSQTIRVRNREMTHVQHESEGALPITEQEYQILTTSTKVSKFWRRAVILSYWLGIRISDVARFQVESIGDDFVIVWTQKRSKRVKLSLSDPLIGHHDLRQVLAELRAEIPAGYCFPEQRAIIDSAKRNLLSMQAIRMMEQNGIQYKSFHSLRASTATRWDAAGKTLLEIGTLLAHADEETTRGYIK